MSRLFFGFLPSFSRWSFARTPSFLNGFFPRGIRPSVTEALGSERVGASPFLLKLSARSGLFLSPKEPDIPGSFVGAERTPLFFLLLMIIIMMMMTTPTPQQQHHTTPPGLVGGWGEWIGFFLPLRLGDPQHG